MRPISFPAATVESTLRRLRVATLPQLVEALGAPSKRTVYRKLRELDTISSYSHGGQYHALRDTVDFDVLGLWAHGEIFFSEHGTLRATAVALIEDAPRGWYAEEFDEIVGVRSAGALRDLARPGELGCVDFNGRSLYCSADPARQKWQVDNRRVGGDTLPMPTPEQQAELAELTSDFASVLDENQQRMFAGLVSAMCGRAGDRLAARLFGMRTKDVREARRELSGPPGSVRR